MPGISFSGGGAEAAKGEFLVVTIRLDGPADNLKGDIGAENLQQPQRQECVEIRSGCGISGPFAAPRGGLPLLTTPGAYGTIRSSMIDPEAVRRAVRAALDEDIGAGDLTSHLVIEAGVRARGDILAREPVVVAGMSVAREVFRQVDESLDFRSRCDDGAVRHPGDCLATVEGAARSILAAERTALNFLQRLCGIAVATRRAVGLLNGARVQITGTRKTAPGLRVLDRYAVEVGGGSAHRQGLFDAVLIKDNHWRLAGGVEMSIERARQEMARVGRLLPIEVEAGTLDEVDEALRAKAEAILLDNMDRATLERAVALARGRAFLEASGGIREEDIAALASVGVDRISLGSLTHSVRAADLALEVRPE